MAKESTYRTLVKCHLRVYRRSWSEMHRLLMPIFQACFGLTKSFREPGDLLFKGVRVLPSAYFVHRRIHFRMCIYKAKIFFDTGGGEGSSIVFHLDSSLRSKRFCAV